MLSHVGGDDGFPTGQVGDGMQNFMGQQLFRVVYQSAAP